MAVLFFLFIMSLMTVSILSHSCLALRMSRNFFMTSQQFQAAEAGLKIAESLAENLQTPILSLQSQFNYADFQVSSALKRHSLSYCINQYQAYIYDITVKVKKNTSNALRLQSTYVIKIKQTCQSGKQLLTKTGRYAWRELNSLS